MRRNKRKGQLALDLGSQSVDRNRGGRPVGPDPRVPHLERESFPESHPCHVTLQIVKGIGSIRRADVVREIENAFRAGNTRKHFRLVHYSIQADHAHLIVEARDRQALGRGMKSLAARFARAINRALGRVGKVLADRYHLRVLKCPRQTWNGMSYVLLNRRRHEKKENARRESLGLPVTPLPNAGTIDGASSARWFHGWRQWVDRSPPCGLGSSPAVAEPQTWLLRIGWQRYGLLDPNGIPG